MQKKVYGYVKSTWYQIPSDQVKEIETFCKSRELNLIKVLIDEDEWINYEKLKEELQTEDIIIVASVQAFGKNANMIIQELKYYREKGIRLINLEIPETTKFYENYSPEIADELITSVGNLYTDMYISMAEAEREKRKRAQKVGWERVQNGEGRKSGRIQKVPIEVFLACYRRYKEQKMTRAELLDTLCISPVTYYNYCNKHCKEQVEEINKLFLAKKDT